MTILLSSPPSQSFESLRNDSIFRQGNGEWQAMTRMGRATYRLITFSKPLEGHRKANLFQCSWNLVSEGLKTFPMHCLHKAVARLQQVTSPLAPIQPAGPEGNSPRGNIRSLLGRQRDVLGIQGQGKQERGKKQDDYVNCPMILEQEQICITKV